MQHGRSMMAVAALALAGAACGESTDPRTPVAEVAIDPPQAAVEVEGSVAFTVTLVDDAGNSLSGRPVTWTVESPEIARVDGGRVTGLAPGTTRIAASSEGRSATATVTVRPRRPGRLALSPESARLTAIGATTTLAVTVFDGTDEPMPGSPVEWRSLDPHVAEVNGEGRVTARANGTARIVATSAEVQEVSATATITVAQAVTAVRLEPSSFALHAGQSRDLDATALDANQVAVQGAAIEWITSSSSVATVDDQGVVRAVRPGQADITAVSDGSRATSRVTVNAAPVDRVVIIPSELELDEGDSKQLQVRLYDAGGVQLDARPVTWTSDNTSRVQVSETGVVTAKREGKAKVTAEVEGKRATITVEVDDD